MGFDLSNYETVADLNRWFQENYPMGRIRVEVLSDDSKEERIIVWAAIYRDANDNNPCVENIARGKQSEYPRHMARFYAEDVTTSAIGRCITLLKGGNTATQDDMRKVESGHSKEAANNWLKENEPVLTSKPTIKGGEERLDTWGDAVGLLVSGLGAKEIESVPPCKHGDMMLKEGTGKTGRPFRGYVCTAPKNDQCPPMWQDLTPQGTWKFRDVREQ